MSGVFRDFCRHPRPLCPVDRLWRQRQDAVPPLVHDLSAAGSAIRRDVPPVGLADVSYRPVFVPFGACFCSGDQLRSSPRSARTDDADRHPMAGFWLSLRNRLASAAAESVTPTWPSRLHDRSSGLWTSLHDSRHGHRRRDQSVERNCSTSDRSPAKTAGRHFSLCRIRFRQSTDLQGQGTSPLRRTCRFRAARPGSIRSVDAGGLQGHRVSRATVVPAVG